MKKFEVGKWYIVKKPSTGVGTKAPAPSELKWIKSMDRYDGRIVQCSTAFFGERHGFLSKDGKMCIAHVDWVKGPYNTEMFAQRCLVYDES